MQAKFSVVKSRLFFGLVGVSYDLGICVSRLFSHLASLVPSESRAQDAASPALHTGYMGMEHL